MNAYDFPKGNNKAFFRTYGKGKKKSIFRACGIGNKLGAIDKVIKLVESETGHKLSDGHIEELTKLGEIVKKLGDIDEVIKLGETNNILGETDELTINRNIKTNLLPNQQSDYVITERLADSNLRFEKHTAQRQVNKRIKSKI